MIQVAVVEDDPMYADTLRGYLEQFQKTEKVNLNLTFYQDGEDIIENYSSDFDVILMDIQMRFMDGMTAAHLIREKDESVIIMFITNMTDYAIRGYEVDAMDYILKPVNYATFSRKFSRALQRVPKEASYLLIQANGGARRIEADSLYYIESQGHVMRYHTADEVFEGRGRMDDLEKELAPYGFFRSNKWYIVNMRHVDGIEGDACLIGGEKLQISRRRRTAFLEELAKVL